ncbi:hypothetical protein RIVM261_041310 [Rivularia sp. IAM M-261]|nr:hypothetical protein RIVM261_041310 [Rivularia sp. IAM M-261]
MYNYLQTNEFRQDIPYPTTDVAELPKNSDVPQFRDVLSDGRETVIIGDVEKSKDFVTPQGDNPYDFRGTCGLVSVAGVLRQFGQEHITEADVVKYAVEHRPPLCDVSNNMDFSGGTTMEQQAKLLGDAGVSARPERLGSLDALAECVSEGRGVIIQVNAGRLWNNDPQSFDNGQANHAIVVTGVAKDPNTGEIQGFFINDSGAPNADRGKFIDANQMQDAWVSTGAQAVVTEGTYV